MPPKRSTTCPSNSSLSASSPSVETTPLAPELRPAQPPPVQVTPLAASSTEQSQPPTSTSLKIFKCPEKITVSTMQHAQTQLLLTKILKKQKLIKQLVQSLQQQSPKGNGVCVRIAQGAVGPSSTRPRSRRSLRSSQKEQPWWLRTGATRIWYARTTTRPSLPMIWLTSQGASGMAPAPSTNGERRSRREHLQR